jgi:hypothetical protein
MAGMSAALSIPVLVVDRRTLMAMFSLERTFMEAWLTKGVGRIPQMPHIPGRPVMFHVPSFEAWYLEHFQRGGRLGERCSKCGR